MCKRKNGFTIVEVSILFVIFLIVAFLVAPLSLNDTLHAKNVSRWKRVQADFNNIFDSINLEIIQDGKNFSDAFNTVMNGEIRTIAKPYKIVFMNGSNPSYQYRYDDYKTTHIGATIAYNLFDNPQDNLRGTLMYDVNGPVGPNAWGKDVFGLNIYSDHFEPFCKNDLINVQKQDCSRQGSGLCCSNYYLIGGNLN